MRDQRLEDYISTLSETEKEQYKCLIEECRQRDSRTKKNCDALRENVIALFESLNDFVKAIDALGVKVRQLRVNMLKVHLRSYQVASVLEQCDRDLLQHYPKSLN